MASPFRKPKYSKTKARMPDAPAPEEWTVLRMLEWATGYLEEKNVPSPRLSIEWLLADLLECKRLDLYLKYDRPLSKSELGSLKPALLRRAAHEPLQYITGSTDFFGLELFTSPAALIPRPETEQLVETILEDHKQDSGIRLLDIGTGSGCIPAAIKKNRPEWEVSACDISDDALKLAQKNADHIGLDIRFFRHDLFEPDDSDHKYDIIVSNPPYIPDSEKDKLELQVRDFEPEIALFHPRVTEVYKAVADFASENLSTGGMLYLEIHEEMGPELTRVFDSENWKTALKKDYSGKDRMIVAEHTLGHIRNVDNL